MQPFKFCLQCNTSILMNGLTNIQIQIRSNSDITSDEKTISCKEFYNLTIKDAKITVICSK